MAQTRTIAQHKGGSAAGPASPALDPSRFDAFLLLPALVLFVPILAGSLAVLLRESVKPHIPGRVGGADEGFTLTNYTELFDPAYIHYFTDTFRIGLVITLAALVLGYPIAHYIVRVASPRRRKALLAGLIGMLFLSLIVRVYAIAMTYGPLGPLVNAPLLIGIQPRTPLHTELMVIFGLLHTVLPLVAITLIGSLQNINPRLEEAALSLGAPRWKAFTSITLALSIPGILSAAIICYAFCISNFVVAMILGKGFVLFISNLIYARFSEVNNFPSGAAIAVIMTLISLALFYGLMKLVQRAWRTEAG